ncbi:helix-turn-helix transcriptional regulator [Rufibacter sp. LB8]|uniref:helix-turn-helix domain-containing protein n=1 Tax=Rufibacter sp. LB8 TaxID=2777781 RepID=UPI001CEFA035|nr:helix-turn-helix transcriptional regulator [Rufibacter sp. LB8]
MKKQRSPQLQRRVDETIAGIAAVADQMPGVIIIHDITRNFAVEYMSPRGLKLLGVTLEELKSVGPEYYLHYFNPEEAVEYFGQLARTLFEQNDPDEVISFFEQVKFRGNLDYHWHLTTLKILLQDDEGLPLLTISIAISVDPVKHLTPKVDRLLKETVFYRENYALFAQLGKREQEILKMVVLGKSSQEISDELCISEKTVNTHRRNIKAKLHAASTFELSQYAMAFDLV